MSRLEELHKAFEEQQPNQYGWVYTQYRLPPTDREIEIWYKCDGVDVIGERVHFRFAEERDLEYVYAWKDI